MTSILSQKEITGWQKPETRVDCPLGPMEGLNIRVGEQAVPGVHKMEGIICTSNCKRVTN